MNLVGAGLHTAGTVIWRVLAGSCVVLIVIAFVGALVAAMLSDEVGG